MLAKRTNDAVAGLHRALRKQRVMAFGPNRRALLFHLFVHEREHLEGGDPSRRFERRAIPHRAPVGRVNSQPGALADHKSVVKRLQFPVHRQRQRPVSAGFFLHDKHAHHIPVEPHVPASQRLGKHLQCAHNPHQRTLVVACPPAKHRSPLHSGRKIRRHHVHVRVQANRCPPLLSAFAGNHANQV